MSLAYQCERCEGYGPNEPVAVVTVASKEPMPVGKGDREYDLCGRCLDELREWLTPEPDLPQLPEVSIDVPFQGGRYHA